MKNCKIDNEELKEIQDFLFEIIKSEVERKVKDEIYELDEAIENSDGYYLNFIDNNNKKKYLYLNNSRLMYGEVIDNDKLHILNSVNLFNNTVDEIMWMVDNVIDDVGDNKNNKPIEIKGNIRLMVNEIYANAKNKAIA